MMPSFQSRDCGLVLHLQVITQRASKLSVARRLYGVEDGRTHGQQLVCEPSVQAILRRVDVVSGRIPSSYAMYVKA